MVRVREDGERKTCIEGERKKRGGREERERVSTTFKQTLNLSHIFSFSRVASLHYTLLPLFHPPKQKPQLATNIPR
jgi:hypothetical protein